MADPNAQMPWLERVVRHAGSEIAGAPGGIASLGGLAQAGITALTTDKSFGESMLSEEGLRISQQVKTIMESPNVSDEDKAWAASQFDPGKHLNTGLAAGHRWYNTGTYWGGNLERRFGFNEDDPEFVRDMADVPLDEEMMGIALSALPGLGATTVAKIGSKIAQIAGRNVGLQYVLNAAKSRPGRISGRVAEMITPFTIPWTPTNAALNVGAQVALNDVVRNFGGDTSVIGMFTGANAEIEQARAAAEQGAPFTTGRAREFANAEVLLNGIDEPPVSAIEGSSASWYDNYGTALALGGATILAAAAALRHRVPNITTDESFLNRGTFVNRNQTNLEDGLEQQVSIPRAIQTRLTDDAAAERSVVRQAVNEEAADLYEIARSANTRAGLEQANSNLFNFGILMDSGKTTVPLRAIKSLTDTLSRSVKINHGIANLKGADNQRDFFEIADLAEQALIDRQVYRDKANAASQAAQNELSKLLAQGAAIKSQGGKRAPVGNLNQKIKAAYQKLQDAQNVEQWSNNSHPSFTKLTDHDLKRIVAIRDTDPRIKEVYEARGKLFEDLLEYARWSGAIDPDTAKRLKTTYGKAYRPLHENPYVGRDTIAGRFLQRSADQLAKTEEPTIPRGATFTERSLDPLEDFEAQMKGSTRPKVNNPMDSLSAMNNYVGTLMRDVAHNRIKTQFIDTMRSNPTTAKGIRLVDKVTPNAFLNSYGKQPNPHHVYIRRSGQVEIYEFADEVLSDSLAFDPYKTISLFNVPRRWYQIGTTGPLAPFFSIKGFLYDVGVATFTKQPDEVLGMLDSNVRRLSNGKRGIPGDPTFLLDGIGGIISGMKATTLKNFGTYFANDLAQSHSWFGELAKSAVGKQALESLGKKMIDRHLRTTLGLMEVKGLFPTDAVALRSPYDFGLLHTNAYDNILVRSWTSIFNSIHNGAKVAHFARNYAELQRVRGGIAPDDAQIRKLAHRAKVMSGDPTKAGTSGMMSNAVSSIPYANITIQSMQHVYGTTARRASQGDFRPLQALFFGVWSPALLGIAGIHAMGPEARDWYYRQLPAWQRVGNFVIPKFWSDNDGPFDPDRDVMMIPIAPELIPLKEAAVQAAESLGLLDNSRAVQGTKDWAEAMSTLANFAAPPVPNAIAGSQGSRLTPGDYIVGLFTGEGDISQSIGQTSASPFSNDYRLNSSVTKEMHAVSTALFGTFMGSMIAAYDAGDASNDAEQSLYDTVVNVFDKLAYEQTKSAPIISSSLWGINKQYAGSTVAETFLGKFNQLESVFGQANVEAYGLNSGATNPPRLMSTGDLPRQITKDVDGVPAAAISALVMRSKMMWESPAATFLRDRMTQLRKGIEMVDGNRTIATRERLQTINQLERERQELAEQFYTNIVQPWERDISATLGKNVDTGEFVDIVKRATGR